MRISTAAIATATCLLGLASTSYASSSNDIHALGRPSYLHRRAKSSKAKQVTNSTDDLAPATEAQQDAIYVQAFTDPVGAAQAANALPYMSQQYATGALWKDNLVGDGVQLPWNSAVPYIPEAAVNGSVDGGWEFLPDIPGMTLNRSTAVVSGGILPFYQTQNYDSTKIKRAVMIMPGKPRDCWKYTSLAQNALAVYASNSSARLKSEEVLILGPCWMSDDDQKAGAVASGELYWKQSDWQAGMASHSTPTLAKGISSYQAIDYILDSLFDKTQFPLLTTAVVAGHSMGAQMVQRYSYLKNSATYDTNVSYWIGNPGSYVWLNPVRPFTNASCDSVGDDYPYGLDGKGVPAYARDRVQNGNQALLNLFMSRRIHFNYGLLDNGQGDTHCEASLQGANHLERGAKFIESLATINKGSLPATHTVRYNPRVSHQDYPMLSYNSSLYNLFEEEANQSIKPASSSTNAKNQAVSGSSTTLDLAQIPLLLATLSVLISVATSLL